MTYAEALDALDALYATLPQIACQRRCQDSCGVIILTKVEWLRITRKLGYTPKGKHNCVCPMLKQGGCSVYAIRPTVCRLWALTAAWACPWGCQPERWLTEAEGYAVLAEAEAISTQVFPATEAAAFAHRVKCDEIAAYIQRAKEAGRV